MPAVPSKVMSGRRITLPEDWCEEQNVKEGDLVLIGYAKDSISLHITPAEIKARSK